MVQRAPSKVVFVGDAGVGKTALSVRLQGDGPFPHAHQATVGGAYVPVTVTCPDGTQQDISLWDTAGDERYWSIVPMYFERADVIRCVFSMVDRDSFAHVQSWVDLAKQKAHLECRFVLVGNKKDQEEHRQVTIDEGRNLAKEIGAGEFLETSALTGYGIAEVLMTIGKLVAAQRQLTEVVAELEPASMGPGSGCTC